MDRSRGEVNGGFVPSGLVANAERASGTALEACIDTAGAPFFYWESPSGLRFACGESAHTVESFGTTRVSAFASALSRLWQNLQYDGPAVARPRVVVGRAFGPGAIDDRWEGFPAAWGMIPAVTVSETDGETWRTTVDTPNPRARSQGVSAEPIEEQSTDPIAILENVPQPDGSSWRQSARAIRRRIGDGLVEKVVLAHARDVRFNRPLDRRTAIERVRAENPESYLVYVEPEPGTCFIAATPERLIEKRGTSIRTEALAGSTQRGRDCTEDRLFADALDDSRKDGQEHSLVVTAIREALESMGAEVEVGARTVTKFERVQHLKTPIRAACTEERSVLSLVDRLHPTPAVGGTPTASALDAIDRAEPFGRGWYAAPTGWVDANGDGTFAVGIRSGVFTGTTGRIFAGAGLVAESDVEDEWAECQLKYRPMLDAFERP